MIDETWKPVVGFEYYDVSDHGRVRSRFPKSGIRLLSTAKGSPYPQVRLSIGGGFSKVATVHSLVAEAFLGPRPVGLVVRHLDDDPMNNCLTNLLYGTQSENVYDAYRNGKRKPSTRDTCRKGHPIGTAPNGARVCYTCRNAWKRVKRREENPNMVLPAKDRTHCPQGHPYEGDNLMINTYGRRLCRTCVNARAAERRKTRKEK